MTDDTLKELVARLAVLQREPDEQLRKTDHQLQKPGEAIGGLERKVRGVTEETGFCAAGKMMIFGTFNAVAYIPVSDT